MTVQINYKNSGSKKILANFILFVDEEFNISSLKKYISNHEFLYISDLVKTTDIKKNLLAFDINSKKKIILVSVKKNYLAKDVENLGAELFVEVNNKELENEYYRFYFDIHKFESLIHKELFHKKK